MARKRKKISTTTRFEVFKRDSFTCQYCGRKAPEVVLELEHIEPHSKGGSDDILNLLTSCWACNNGKSDRLLSDDAVLQKQRGQIEELQERREQLEMMLRWREGNKDIEGDALRAFVSAYEAHTPGWSLNETGMKSAKTLIKKFGLQRALEAIDAAADQVIRLSKKGLATEDSVKKMFGAAFINAEPPDVQKLYRIRGRIRNRWNYVNDGRCIGALRRVLDAGAPIAEIEDRCHEIMGRSPSSFNEWCGEMDEWVYELRSR